MELLNYEILNASGKANKSENPMFSAITYPAFIDLSFNAPKSVHDVIPVFPDGTENIFEVFASLDGVNFYAFGDSDRIARYIRIFVKYTSGKSVIINNIEILGEDCAFPQKKAKFIEPQPFDGSVYDKEVTDDDIINDVKGIIARTIGEKYVEGFELRLDRRLKDDYAEVKPACRILTRDNGKHL